ARGGRWLGSLFMLAFFALLWSTATPFQPLPGVATPGPAGGRQELPHLAASPGASPTSPIGLAVWNDFGAGTAAVHATRFDATTMVLLAGPIDVTVEPLSGNGRPRVAFGGRAFDPNGYFLVAWDNFGQLCTARVTLDGGVSMPAQQVIAAQALSPVLVS